MPGLINYTQCPACASDSIHTVLSARDHTVSQELFEIWECENCSLRFTQNVPDENTISPYYQSDAYVSHSDTRAGLINRLYHLVRSHTLTVKRKLLKRVTGRQQGELLDIGAGTGAFAHAMQAAGWMVTGIEPDETARHIARNKFGLELKPADVLSNMEPGRFDAVTMWHVLEHVHDLHGYLDHCHRIIKPGGKLVIAVPNYTSLDANVYKEYWAAYDVPRHLYHFSPVSMEKLAIGKGFMPVSVSPMWFDSFYVSMLSERYRRGRGNMPAAMMNGVLSNLEALRNYKKCSSVIYTYSKK